MRRGHHSLKPINVVVDKETGEYRLPHRMCAKDLTYRGRQVVADIEEEATE